MHLLNNMIITVRKMTYHFWNKEKYLMDLLLKGVMKYKG